MYLLLNLRCFPFLYFNSGVKGTHPCVLMFLSSPPPCLPCSALCPKEMALPRTTLSLRGHLMACSDVTTGRPVETEVRLVLFILSALVPHLSGRGYIPPCYGASRRSPRKALDLPGLGAHASTCFLLSGGQRLAPVHRWVSQLPFISSLSSVTPL